MSKSYKLVCPILHVDNLKLHENCKYSRFPISIDKKR